MSLIPPALVRSNRSTYGATVTNFDELEYTGWRKAREGIVMLPRGQEKTIEVANEVEQDQGLKI